MNKKPKQEPEDLKAEPPSTAEASPSAAAAAETAALQDRLLRLQADFDNFRKRTARERNEIFQRANEELMLELLPVVDHFELGLQTARQHHADGAVVEGFQIILDQLLAALTKFGLCPIDAEGQRFDPHLHEAATHMPSEQHAEDMVILQTRRGYRLGDKLLRAAQVVVSSGPAEPAPDEE